MTKRWFSPFLRGKIILPRFFVIGITCFADIENASNFCERGVGRGCRLIYSHRSIVCCSTKVQLCLVKGDTSKLYVLQFALAYASPDQIKQIAHSLGLES